MLPAQVTPLPHFPSVETFGGPVVDGPQRPNAAWQPVPQYAFVEPLCEDLWSVTTSRIIQRKTPEDGPIAVLATAVSERSI